MKRCVALVLALAMALSMMSAWAEVVTPTGNTYGFAGTNGKYYTDQIINIEVLIRESVLSENEGDAGCRSSQNPAQKNMKG